MTTEEARKLLQDSREKLTLLRGMLLQIEAEILSLEQWLAEREQTEQALNAANAELAKRSKQEIYDHYHHH